jgi:hypothetical protein
MLCKHLDGKAFFTGILRLYADIHREIRDSLQPEHEEQTEEFREQKRLKRNPSDGQFWSLAVSQDDDLPMFQHTFKPPSSG